MSWTSTASQGVSGRNDGVEAATCDMKFLKENSFGVACLKHKKRLSITVCYLKEKKLKCVYKVQHQISWILKEKEIILIGKQRDSSAVQQASREIHNEKMLTLCVIKKYLDQVELFFQFVDLTNHAKELFSVSIVLKLYYMKNKKKIKEDSKVKVPRRRK